MSGFILAAFGIFFAVLIGLGLSLITARRRVGRKLEALETVLDQDATDAL